MVVGLAPQDASDRLIMFQVLRDLIVMGIYDISVGIYALYIFIYNILHLQLQSTRTLCCWLKCLCIPVSSKNLDMILGLAFD